MLASRHRLRRSREFTAAFRTGKRAGRATLVVHLHVDAEADARQDTGAEQVSPRAGFVVSRAVGSAVVRNRVRRRLRHLVAAHLPSLPSGTVLVVRALPPAAEASHRRLAADLVAALRSAATKADITARDHP